MLHPGGSRWIATVLALTLLTPPVGRAWAQASPAAPAPSPAPTPPGAPPSDAPSAPDPAKKAEAKAHFDKGFALLEQDALAAALAEFLISRELYPTRVATFNAAIALKKLLRFDESLDMYELLLRDFPNLPPDDRKEAQLAIAAMRELVGTIEIKGAEPGAAIVVSGQARGEYPPVTPLRVAAGSHLVRVLKDGFEPFEAKVDVAGGQTVPVAAKLRPMVASGRLRVVERNGRKFDVVIGGALKGQTPWEGVLPVGDTSVSLRGKGGIEGTAPALASIKAQQVSTLTLIAEELDAPLRVTPTPTSASVTIDGVPVGGGIWTGRLKSGPHRIGAALTGYQPEVKDVKLDRGRVMNLAIKLEIDPSSPMWKKPSHWFIDGDAGLFMQVLSVGGPAGCSGCSAPLGKGVRGTFHTGYELGNGFGFGFSLGYLLSMQSVTGRAEKLNPVGYDPKDPKTSESGTAQDDLRLSAFLGGIHGSFRTGEKFPFLIRLGAGALVGQARDERSGSFVTVNTVAGEHQTYPIETTQTQALAAYLYADLALRIGVRLGDHVDVSAGLQVLALFALSQPKWDKTIQLHAGKPPKPGQAPPDGSGSYSDDPIMGQVVLGLVPALSARYTF